METTVPTTDDEVLATFAPELKAKLAAATDPDRPGPGEVH